MVAPLFFSRSTCRTPVDDYLPPMGDSSARAAAAAKILTHPADYKVCEGCGSIVLKKALLCPNCHAYRFDESVTRVILQAGSLAREKPLPSLKTTTTSLPLRPPSLTTFP